MFSESMDDAVQYVFIDEYCGNKDEITDGSLEIYSNGISETSDFRINSFAFVSDVASTDASVYMHCEVRWWRENAQTSSFGQFLVQQRSILPLQTSF